MNHFFYNIALYSNFIQSFQLKWLLTQAGGRHTNDTNSLLYVPLTHTSVNFHLSDQVNYFDLPDQQCQNSGIRIHIHVPQVIPHHSSSVLTHFLYNNLYVTTMLPIIIIPFILVLTKQLIPFFSSRAGLDRLVFIPILFFPSSSLSSQSSSLQKREKEQTCDHNVPSVFTCSYMLRT